MTSARPAPSAAVSTDSLADWLTDLLSSGTAEPNDHLYEWLCPVDVARLQTLSSRLARVAALKTKSATKRGRQSNLIGRLFELIIKELVRNSRALKYY